MDRFFLGVDYRFSLLAFGYTTILSGLFMRFVMGGDLEIGVIFVVAMGMIPLAAISFYRGAATNFLYMSWLAIQHPKDDGLANRLVWLMNTRRLTAVFLGGACATFNNSIMMWLKGGSVFSWASLLVLLVLTTTAHWGWFTNQGRGNK